MDLGTALIGAIFLTVCMVPFIIMIQTKSQDKYHETIGCVNFNKGKVERCKSQVSENQEFKYIDQGKKTGILGFYK